MKMLHNPIIFVTKLYLYLLRLVFKIFWYSTCYKKLFNFFIFTSM